jgi:hypothetical protein
MMQVPGMRASQARAIGVHWKMLRRTMAMSQAMKIPPRTIETIQISLVGKMRQYMSRIGTLVTAIVAT